MPTITLHETLDLPEQTLTGHLTAIRPSKNDPKLYSYTVTLPPKDRRIAECYVPSNQIRPDTKADLRRRPEVTIPIEDSSKCSIVVTDLVGEDESRKRYVRDIVVTFKERKYAGYIYIPATTKEGKAIERMILNSAAESIEDEAVEPPVRRTVEFFGPIKQDKQVTTEVWSEDGEDSWKGMATVLKMEVTGGRRYLTIKAPASKGKSMFLVGDVGDTNFARCGRFQEVESADGTASKAFKLPPWREEE